PAFSVLDDPVDQILFIAVIALRKQNILRAVGDSAPESDISGVPSHNLDNAAAFMGSRGIADLIDSFHSCIHRRVKTDGIIRTGNIQINGSRKADGVDPKSRQLSGSTEGSVAA